MGIVIRTALTSEDELLANLLEEINGRLGPENITRRSLTGNQIADNAIENRHVGDGAIGTAELAGSAVTSAKIATLPKARVHHSVAQGITTSTWLALGFDSERFDSDTIHDTGTNPSRLTCKTAGLYLITGGVHFQANGTGRRIVEIMLNGTTGIGRDERQAVTVAGIGTGISVATIYQLAVNDYVELRAFQDSGGGLNAEVVPNAAPEFAMAWIGP